MPSPRRNNEGLLARVNFPLYTLQMLTSRHVIVGGGGGSSKTGVANGFVSNLSAKVCILNMTDMWFLWGSCTEFETVNM